MRAWINVCVSFLHDYKDGIFLIILVLLFILMLIVLKTVRKNNQNMRGWNAGIAKMTKALDEVLDEKVAKETAERKIHTAENEAVQDTDQRERMDGNLKEDQQSRMEETESTKKQQESRKKQKEEELFGRVLQEYFP